MTLVSTGQRSIVLSRVSGIIRGESHKLKMNLIFRRGLLWCLRPTACCWDWVERSINTCDFHIIRYGGICTAVIRIRICIFSVTSSTFTQWVCVILMAVEDAAQSAVWLLAWCLRSISVDQTVMFEWQPCFKMMMMMMVMVVALLNVRQVVVAVVADWPLNSDPLCLLV